MMTQEECSNLVQNMSSADILISHDKAYIYDRHHIPIHIYGHLHEEYEENLRNGSRSMGIYKIKLMQI